MFLQNQLILKMTLILPAIVLWLVTLSEGYNILVIFPYPVKSHVILGDGIVRHLLKSGHQITYITPFVENVQENLTYIDVSITKSALAGKYFNLETLMTKPVYLEQDSIARIFSKIFTQVLENDKVKNLMQNPKQHFDLVIAEWLFNERYSGFSAVFNCPYVWVFPFEPNFLATRLIDEATHPAYTGNFELGIDPPYTFLERARNLWYQIIYELNLYFYYDVTDREAFDAVFQPVIMEKHGYKLEYDDVRYNASLVLTYTHSSFGYAERSPANMIAVGGYHVNDNIQPLPTDLKSIMDNSKYGVIYFSMGSNLKSKEFPKQVLKDLTVMFGKLKQTVLWKFEDDLLDCPKNLHILKWVPQQSILAHPKCILFITHGGLLSLTETVHFGVPIIGIPIIFDQFINVDKAVKKGFGKKITLCMKFAQDIEVAIGEILEDSRYTTKAKEASYIYHHRPVPPGQELVHWVEHVVSTRGAPHLGSPALHMPWYQKIYLDLTALVAFVTTSVYIMLKFIFKRKKCKLNVQTKKLA